MSGIIGAFFSASVTQTGGAGVAFDAVVEQTRDDTVTGIADFNAAVTFSTVFTGVYDNATARVRWTGARIVFDGLPLHPTAYYGRITEDETMVPGQARTMRFATIGPLWTIPTETYTPPPGSGAFDNPPGSAAPPASPPEAPPVTDFSPRAWGNKEVELYLSFGASPRTMAELKVYQGLTLQKSNRGDIAIVGDITCSDDSLKYANVPLCYQLPPFGGLRRDQIVRALAANAGVPAGKVFVPVGHLVTKPILLSNGSLVPFVNELGEPENWFAYFDEDGDFVVEKIELKTEPDWTIDARRGDFDQDTFEEQPPTMPPTRYYASGTVPVTGTGTETTSTTSELRAIYNPQCVKVRPSGLTSYLQSDGSYRSLAAAVDMVVGRVVTEITTTNGRETRRVISTYQFYNPLRYDTNFDTAPPGTSYDGAYGNRTFHRDEVESLMLVKTVTTEASYDIYGTLQRQVETTSSWYAPKRAGNYSADRKALTNLSGVCFVFPGGTTRTMAEEQFMVTASSDRTYSFDLTGVLSLTDSKDFAWFAPPSRCDVPLNDVTVTDPPPDGDGGGGGDGTPLFSPTLVGPTHFFPDIGWQFQWSLDGIPTGVIADINITGANSVQPGTFNFVDTAPFQGYWEFIPNSSPVEEQPFDGNVDVTTVSGEWTVSVPFPQGGERVSPYTYVVLTVTDGDGTQYSSERIYFDARVKTFTSFDGSTERFLLI